jgi:hypothetical protein
MPRPTRILTWLMLAMLVGGHWGMLQVVAWSSMLISYSQDATFAEAWDKTFSGEHPCAICKTVDRGIAADLVDDERKGPGKCFKTVKLDAVVNAVVLMPPTTRSTCLLPTPEPQLTVGIRGEPLRRPPQVMG